jgi:hypothetical protein
MNPNVRRVWPEPPDGLQYVRQTLTGGEYISTGLFRVGTVDDKGRGRTFDQCERVTSLFFDLDLLTLFDAVRLSRGRVLEARAQARKARMYRMDKRARESLLGIMLDEYVPQLEAVIGAPPSLVLMSGWGYHAHYAVDADIGAEKTALRAIHAAVVDVVNLQVAEIAGAMSPPLTSYVSAFDRTHDVGARLCRLPGSSNRKAAGRHFEVEVVHASDTVLTRADLVRLQDAHTSAVDPGRPCTEARQAPAVAYRRSRLSSATATRRAHVASRRRRYRAGREVEGNLSVRRFDGRFGVLRPRARRTPRRPRRVSPSSFVCRRSARANKARLQRRTRT